MAHEIIKRQTGTNVPREILSRLIDKMLSKDPASAAAVFAPKRVFSQFDPFGTPTGAAGAIPQPSGPPLAPLPAAPPPTIPSGAARVQATSSIPFPSSLDPAQALPANLAPPVDFTQPAPAPAPSSTPLSDELMKTFSMMVDFRGNKGTVEAPAENKTLSDALAAHLKSVQELASKGSIVPNFEEAFASLESARPGEHEAPSVQDTLASLLGAAAAGGKGQASAGDFFLGAGAGVAGAAGSLRAHEEAVARADEETNAKVDVARSQMEQSLAMAVATGERQHLQDAVALSKAQFDAARSLDKSSTIVQGNNVIRTNPDGSVNWFSMDQFQEQSEQLEFQLDLSLLKMREQEAKLRQQALIQQGATLDIQKTKALIDLKKAEQSLRFGAYAKMIQQGVPQPMIATLGVMNGSLGQPALRKAVQQQAERALVLERGNVEASASPDEINQQLKLLRRADRNFEKLLETKMRLILTTQFANNARLMNQVMGLPSQGAGGAPSRPAAQQQKPATPAPAPSPLATAFTI